MEINIRPQEIVIKRTPPHFPFPTALTETYYPTKIDIANAILRLFGKTPLATKLSFEELHLSPNHTITIEPSPIPSTVLMTVPPEKEHPRQIEDAPTDKTTTQRPR